jgi:hypothetical protein
MHIFQGSIYLQKFRDYTSNGVNVPPTREFCVTAMLILYHRRLQLESKMLQWPQDFQYKLTENT